MEQHEKSEQQEQYQQLNEASSQALNRRELDRAIELCEEALTLFPNDVDVQLEIGQRKAIAASMRGDEDALEQFRVLRELAQEQGGDAREGDILRDTAFAQLRVEDITPEELGQVEVFIQEAAQLHEGDENRQAALEGARGRLAFARGEYENANEYHQKADEMWSNLGEEANMQWAYNNYLPHLRAVAALGDREAAEALTRKIVEDDDKFTDDHRDKIEKIWQKYFQENSSA